MDSESVQRLAYRDRRIWGQVEDEIGHFRQKTHYGVETAGNGSSCLEFPPAHDGTGD